MPEEYESATRSYDREKDKLLDRFEREIKRCEANWRDELQAIRRSRRLVAGEIPDSVPRDSGDNINILNAQGTPFESESGSRANKVRANLLLATNESMLPLVYARNPDVSARPAERVTRAGGSEYEQVKEWAKTLELVVSQQLKTGGLKKQAKKAVRSIQAAKLGVLKVTYQREFETDPQIANRVNDLQDNLTEIEGRLRALTEDDVSDDNEELKAQELRQMIEGLQQTPEVMIAEGVVVDQIPIDNFRMDPSVWLVEDYTQASWLAHFVDMRVEDYRTRYDVGDEEMKGVKLFRRRDDGDTELASSAYTPGTTTLSDTGEEIVRLWELWHRTDNLVYQWCEGAMDWAREPWSPSGLGRRWYPFWLLGFHWIDGLRWPQSPVDLLEGLQQEYNDTREQKNEHRRANVPHYIASSDADPETVRSFTVAGAREVVIVDTQGRPINEIFAPSPGIPLNPSMYTTEDTRFDMQWVSGVQDAARGGVVKAKTLGEAEIAENHLASRASNFQDEIEEAMTEIAEYVAQTCLQRMRPETVRKIAGDNAVWPMLPRQDVYELFEVEVRAGSTGKPDRRMEQEQWREMLPLITDLVSRIMEQAQDRQTPEGAVIPGTPYQANPMTRVLEETLKRFDERLDVESFLEPPQAMQQPQQQPQQPMGPQMQPGMAGGQQPQQPGQAPGGGDMGGSVTQFPG